MKCPKCKSEMHKTKGIDNPHFYKGFVYWICKKCGFVIEGDK